MIATATKLDVAQYTVQYELLRFQVIGSPGTVVPGQPRGVGLALFLSEGMPGWLRTVESVLRTARPPHAVETTDSAPSERCPETNATPVWCDCQLDLAHFDTLIWPPSNADSPPVFLRCW